MKTEYEIMMEKRKKFEELLESYHAERLTPEDASNSVCDSPNRENK